ncbi:MAG TPA: hypothetical protein VG276_12830 [Actinomycetes bacterium]|nr:hypothetical protein [Actinomycetes bacterium]
MSARPPDPAELHVVAARADLAATDLARVVGSAASAGIIIDDEITIAVATITSWAAWLGGLATGEALAQRGGSTGKEGHPK